MPNILKLIWNHFFMPIFELAWYLMGGGLKGVIWLFIFLILGIFFFWRIIDFIKDHTAIVVAALMIYLLASFYLYYKRVVKEKGNM
jgi:apolipoprotein N-acyltransferase